MFTTQQCPGCTGTDLSVLERIAVDAVIKGYEGEVLKTPVSYLFPGDARKDMLLCECRGCKLRWYADSPSGDGRFYEALQQHDWYYQSDKPEYVFAAEAIKPGDRILEVGCGRGAFTSLLPENIAYRGLEFNDAAVAAARKIGLDVEKMDVAQAAAEQPASYDVVCHFQVLEHVEDPLGFMRDCAAAIRPGGRMIVAVPSEDSFVGIAESCFLNMPPHHLTRWSDEALSNIMTKIGLRLTETWHEDVASYHTDWHQRVLNMAGLRDLIGSQPQQMTSRLFKEAERVLFRVPGARTALINRGLAANPFGSRGHTVCVVATKPAG